MPKAADWRIAKSIFVADDEATAQRYAYGSDGPYYFYFRQLIRKLVGAGGRGNLFKTDPDMPNEAITPEYVTKRLVLAGTVDSVVAQLLAFREQVGDFGTLLYAGHDWVDSRLARRSRPYPRVHLVALLEHANERTHGGAVRHPDAVG